ncbi:hypothetical protein CHI08_04920 [Peribacillus simplex]|nr:hypothetical protein CHI08_04920 [Peribacillus simplex]
MFNFPFSIIKKGDMYSSFALVNLGIFLLFKIKDSQKSGLGTICDELVNVIVVLKVSGGSLYD